MSELATGNVEPEPENISSYEIVYEQGIGKHLRTSVSGYYDQVGNLTNIQSGVFTNFNVDTMGTELALEGKWDEGNIITRASYTLQHSEDRTDGGGLPDSPMHMLKFNVSAPVWQDKIFAGLEVQYTSRSQTIFYNPARGQNGGYVPGYTVVNFTFSA